MNLNSDSILTTEAEKFLDEWFDHRDYVVAHTSGSTGTPKEIYLKKSDMVASAKATAAFFNITSASTLLLPLSPSYIAGKMQIVRALTAGCRLVAEKPSSTPLADYHGECTLVPIVPSQLDGLLASGATPRIKNVIIGGAPLSPNQEEAIISADINAYATYGMTETCSHVALRRIGEQTYQGLPGFTFLTDDRGCLIVKSVTLSFRQLITNDMVKLSEDNRFEWLGRYDNVINSGGIKIHPEEIERALLPLLPHGSTAYVTSRASVRWGQEAVIVTDSRDVTNEILDRLKEMLPPHHTPHDVIHIDNIPHTSSGKIKRERL